MDAFYPFYPFDDVSDRDWDLIDAGSLLDGFKYCLFCRDRGIDFDDCLAQIVNARGGLVGAW